MNIDITWNLLLLIQNHEWNMKYENMSNLKRHSALLTHISYPLSNHSSDHSNMSRKWIITTESELIQMECS